MHRLYGMHRLPLFKLNNDKAQGFHPSGNADFLRIGVVAMEGDEGGGHSNKT